MARSSNKKLIVDERYRNPSECCCCHPATPSLHTIILQMPNNAEHHLFSLQVIASELRTYVRISCMS
ncbi:hypothetical protein LOAG_02062 [Loa loa]|uniref:Uncharacterized protein n=1 Tax=Loa loa TaxID=7209 RepID=A0A1S0U9D6_LOALO|nr:hypothetical protein LOAG_02062 [Loa loa]EFO26417.2 hypothetical protein LOAG_02062 [Loa loa]